MNHQERCQYYCRSSWRELNDGGVCETDGDCIVNRSTTYSYRILYGLSAIDEFHCIDNTCTPSNIETCSNWAGTQANVCEAVGLSLELQESFFKENKKNCVNCGGTYTIGTLNEPLTSDACAASGGTWGEINDVTQDNIYLDWNSDSSDSSTGINNFNIKFLIDVKEETNVYSFTKQGLQGSLGDYNPKFLGYNGKTILEIKDSNTKSWVIKLDLVTSENDIKYSNVKDYYIKLWSKKSDTNSITPQDIIDDKTTLYQMINSPLEIGKKYSVEVQRVNNKITHNIVEFNESSKITKYFDGSSSSVIDTDVTINT